jgi:hypothetical protein
MIFSRECSIGIEAVSCENLLVIKNNYLSVKYVLLYQPSEPLEQNHT